jgi:protein associated with RNAse G/E
MITVNSRSYDGQVRRSWKCELVERVDPLLVFVGEFETDVRHTDLGHIKRGTISYEYYWLDRWYNIFRFHEPTGELRNYYCNINLPPTFDGSYLDYVDLDIDVLVRPDLTYTVLDREDFERNAELYGYPDDVTAKVEATLNELLELIDTRQLPEVFATVETKRRETL